MRAALGVLLLALASSPAAAQVDGHVSVMFDVLPDIDAAEGRQQVSELRTRIFAERRDEFGPHLRLNLAGYVDGLLANRHANGVEGTAQMIARDGRLAVATDAGPVLVESGEVHYRG